MTDEETKVISQLRDQGYLIVIFTPEELGDAPPSKIEDSLIDKAWGLIDYWNYNETN